MSRIPLVSIQQAARTIVLTLLPLSFISLLIWATAGSTNGNTSDPLRAALWIFLASHQVPLQLALSNATLAGTLSYLPLGALVIPFIATRSGIARTLEILGEIDLAAKRLVLLDYSLAYSILGYLISLPALGDSVRTPFYLAIPILFLVAFVGAFTKSGLFLQRNRTFPWLRAVRSTLIALLFLIGISAVIFAISLGWHFRTVINLTEVIAPGITGGVALLLGQLLYLPNSAVATLSYLSGAGIQIGNGTVISPLIHRVDEIPAIPVLGALPIRTHIWALLLIIIIALVGARMVLSARQTFSDLTEQRRFLLTVLASFLLISLFLSRASSGELLSSNLSSVGPIWWLMPILLTSEVALGMGIAIYAPQVINGIKVRVRG